MKKYLLTLLCALAAPLLLNAAEDDGWLTNYEEAAARAKAENKLLLMNFTGSDWCIWCKRLEGEVFSRPAFKAFAKENLVLLKLDFPRRGNQSEAERKQNRELAEKFGIEGFPTIIVLKPDGSKAAELGYLPGGPEAWIEAFKKATGS
ncbi:MAG: thioredoxin family protein [Verrucomicrobia bacterium]|nr:MAG: thioredoxin family protein [Verrucomicrobiota bacterium]